MFTQTRMGKMGDIQNDVAAIILKLGPDWDVDALKELAEILSGIVKDFCAAKLPITMEMVTTKPMNRSTRRSLHMPKRGVILADASGKLRMIEAQEPSAPEAPETQDEDLEDLL